MSIYRIRLMIAMMQIPLNLIVVKSLSEGELSGYDLMKKIKSETGYWKPSPGTMYPLLEKLENRGLVISRQDGKKRLYKLTPKAKVFMKIADAKKAAMEKYAICCIRTYKFLFGDDVIVPVIEEDRIFAPFSAEITELKDALRSAATSQKNPKKIREIRNTLKNASDGIKNLEGV